MSRGGRLILAGVGLGVLGWMVFRGYQGARVDTADGEAAGWLSGADDFVNVAYTIGGGNMGISLAGLAAIKKHEGYRATPYKDVAGFWTGGYGHKLEAWEHKETRTEEEWTRILAQDVATAETAVNNLVKVPLEQYQFDALVSFVYNVGVGAFRRSTMLKLLNQGNYSAAAGEFSKWVKAGGKTVQGLVNRRTAEANLFKGLGVVVA
jgi:lysozyme